MLTSATQGVMFVDVSLSLHGPASLHHPISMCPSATSRNWAREHINYHVQVYLLVYDAMHVSLLKNYKRLCLDSATDSALLARIQQ
jgi:hypothetical protein